MRAALCIAVALLAGCAETSKLGWVDETLYGTRAVGPAHAAYAGADRINVYAEADASSPVQGVLALHEKVTRYQSESGFAYVEADGNLAGWVREQQLVTSRPQAHKPAAEPAPPAPAEPPPATEPGAETPAPDAKPTEPEPSVFDPY